MNSIHDKVFYAVPLAAMLCNLFLVLTCVSAKKDRTIKAFIHLLLIFTGWTAGSFFMRMMLYPGSAFWYQVSICCTFLVPCAYYQFLYHFCGARGHFLKNLVLILSIAVTVPNLFNVYFPDPKVITVNGERTFTYGVSWTVAIPIVVMALIICAIVRLMMRAIAEDLVPVSHFVPVLAGIAIMFFCTCAAVLPQMVSLPIDTLSCGINAVCLYYALYKKRLISLTQMASSGSSYLIAAVFTTICLVASYSAIENFFSVNFSQFGEQKTIIIAVVFSLLTMLVYHATRFLMNGVFVKRQEQQEAVLKEFSHAISNTLDVSEIMQRYQDLLQESMPDQPAYVFVLENGEYRIRFCTYHARERSLTLPADHPLPVWLQKYQRGVFFNEFRKTHSYKAMWESEKASLIGLHAYFLLPMTCEGGLAGFTVFTDERSSRRHGISNTDITFLESVAAILSIALKNASLYSAIQNEARRDGLTGLFNRSYFVECAKRDLRLCRRDQATLLLINLDDFHLYNELYGSAAGDEALRAFSDALQIIIGSQGTVARYGGKEFAVFLPMRPASTAYTLAQRLSDWLRQYSTGGTISKDLTFSAGICSYPVSAANMDELIRYAGMAVYRAKRTGKNKIIIYAAEQEEQSEPIDVPLADNCAATIYALAAATDAKDHYTFNHSNNVARYAAILAENIPLDREHVDIIRQAGLLHDIGKIGVPESILCKPGRLDPGEYEIMKRHVEASISMIRYLPSLDYVIPSVIGHHERWDGKGYPRGLAGESIPLGARCLCIADSFDAMTSRRSYRDAMSVEDALAEIRRNLGTQFDPTLGALFIQLVESGQITVHPGIYTQRQEPQK